MPIYQQQSVENRQRHVIIKKGILTFLNFDQALGDEAVTSRVFK